MTVRSPDYPIDPLFHQRWSPRAFTGESLPEGVLLSLLEAARWAPSAYNLQPWRFLFSRRGDRHWQDFVSLLDAFNQRWAPQAGALIFVLSDTESSRSHSFDAGAAWAQLALQANRLGYHVRAMAGIDFERAREHLRVPARYRIEAAVAAGRRADPATLPDDLREREVLTPRRPLHELAFAGTFPAEPVSQPAAARGA